VSVAIFLTMVPFAKGPLAPVSAFIPIDQTALVVNDRITAILLFGQFSAMSLMPRSAPSSSARGRRVS